jgi:hypothetical protein
MAPHHAALLGWFRLNYLSVDEGARIREGCGANYPRLVEIKQKYNPTNLFRVNQNIQPVVGAAI